jgi:hypothetical protein
LSSSTSKLICHLHVDIRKLRISLFLAKKPLHTFIDFDLMHCIYWAKRDDDAMTYRKIISILCDRLLNIFRNESPNHKYINEQSMSSCAMFDEYLSNSNTHCGYDIVRKIGSLIVIIEFFIAFLRPLLLFYWFFSIYFTTQSALCCCTNIKWCVMSICLHNDN